MLKTPLQKEKNTTALPGGEKGPVCREGGGKENQLIYKVGYIFLKQKVASVQVAAGLSPCGPALFWLCVPAVYTAEGWRI